MIVKYKLIISYLFVYISCLPTFAQEEDRNKVVTKTTQVNIINFNYATKDLIPDPFPKIPINKEVLLQNKLSIEDLRKMASIDYDEGWNDLSKKLINYQRSLVTPKKLISMDEYLELAIKNNPTLSANKFQVLSSIWREIARIRKWIPSITVTSGSVGSYKGQLYVNSRNPKNPTDGNGSVSSYSSDYFMALPSATISWDAFDPTRGPSIMIEKKAVERDKLLLNYSIRSLVVDIYDSYSEMEVLLEQINAFSELLALQISVADAIYRVYQQGLTSVAEVAQWRAKTYDSITRLTSYYQSLNETYAKFSRVIGDNNYFPLLPTQKDIILGKWPLDLEESIGKAQKENERIKAQYIQSQISGITAEKFVYSYLPTISFGASATNSIINGPYQAPLYQADPILPNSTQNTTNPYFQVYGSFNMTFDGGVNLANAKAERMNQQKALYEAKDIENEITQQVRDSYNGLSNNSIKIVSAEKSEKNSKKAVIVYKQRFIAGLTDTTPFIQAVDQYTSSIISRSAVKRAIVSDYINLSRSTATWPSYFEKKLQNALESIMNRTEKEVILKIQ
jgi:outer membrane protein TolC